MESQPKHLSANANRASRRRAKHDDSTTLMPNPTVSRRTFLSATAVVGALSFLGSLVSPKGTVVNAYADEAGNTHFSVYVLGKDEVPVMAMRQTATGNVAVGGVKVTITSLYNQKQVVATTGDDGFVPVHIRDLSFQCDEDDASSYAFFADVTASADGYRDVHFTKEYLESAVPAAEDGSRPNVVEIPMEADDGSSYLLSASMDDVDILHSSAPAQIGDYNDIEHTIAVEVACAATASSTAATVSLIVDDTEWGSATAVQDPDKSNLSKASFTDCFLSKIQAGQKLKLRFQVPGEAAKTVTLPLEFEPAVTVGLGSNKIQAAPGTPVNDVRGPFSMMWFFGEGDQMSFGIPLVPLEFFADMTGNHGFSVTILTFQPWKNVNGQSEKPDGFKMFGGKVGMAGWNDWKKNVVGKSWGNLKDAMTDDNDDLRFLGASKFSSQLAVNMDVSLMGYAKSEYIDKDAMSGDTKGSGFLGISGRVGLDISMGQQYIVGIYPLYLSIDISFSVTVRSGLMMRFKNYLEDVEWYYNPLNVFPGIVNLCAQASLTVGCGLRGVVGVGVRGYAFFSGTALIGQTKQEDEPVTYTAKAQAGLQVFIQVFVFYKSFLICHPVEWNYPEQNATALNKALDSLDFSDAKTFSQEALLATAEFKAEKTEAADDDTLAAAPETFTPIRSHVLVDRSPLVAAGPADAPGFATPYGALDANGDVLLGASCTSDLACEDHQDAFKSVKTYNPRLGLIPVEQEVIYDQVFSNSHVRTFTGNAYYSDNPEKSAVMARLVTVSIPDNAMQTWTRTRVYVRPWDAEKGDFGAEQVIAFNVDGLEAKNRYDVDYDIDVVDMDGKTYLALAVTSIEVDGAEQIGYDEASNRQFLTFMLWDLERGCATWVKSLHSVLTENDRSTYHPRVVVEGKLNCGVHQWQHICCFYYFRKIVGAEQSEGIFASTYYAYDGQAGTTGDYGNGINIAGASSGKFTGNGTFDVACPDHSSWQFPDCTLGLLAVVACQETDGTADVCAFRLGTKQSQVEAEISLSNVASITMRGKHEDNVPFTYTLGGDTPEEKLNRVIKYDAATCTLSDVETSGYTSDANIFASADGKRLYTVRLSEGGDYQLSDEAQALLDEGAGLQSSVHYCPDTGANYGGAATDDDQQEPVYQLLESRWIESLGAFHKFYPIARLSFAPDNTSILACANGRRDFVMASLTNLPQMEDADTSEALDVKSDIYHVSVPDVVAIQCEGVTVGTSFAAAGDTVTYEVEVSNIGNCLVNGFTVTLRDGDGKVIDEKACDDLREYLQETPDNYHPVYEDGEAVMDEDGSVVTEFVEDIRDTSGILWPGFLRKYRFSFTMPEGYEGKTEFSVQVSEPRSNPYANALTADGVLQAGNLSMPSHLSWLEPEDFAETLLGASLQTICDPRRMPFSMEQKAVSEAVATSFSAVPATYQTDDDIDGGGYEPEPTPEPSDNSGKKAAKVKVPETGDKLRSAKGVAAAALVTAAAAGAVKHHEAKREDDAS